MRLNSKWNRRSFLCSLGVIAGSVLAPRKLFSRNRGANSASTRVSGFGQTGNPYEAFFALAGQDVVDPEAYKQLRAVSQL